MSKRLIVNTATTITAILILLTGNNEILPEQYHKFLLLAVSIINIILQKFFNTEGGTNILKNL